MYKEKDVLYLRKCDGFSFEDFKKFARDKSLDYTYHEYVGDQHFRVTEVELPYFRNDLVSRELLDIIGRRGFFGELEVDTSYESAEDDETDTSYKSVAVYRELVRPRGSVLEQQDIELRDPDQILRAKSVISQGKKDFRPQSKLIIKFEQVKSPKARPQTYD